MPLVTDSQSKLYGNKDGSTFCGAPIFALQPSLAYLTVDSEGVILLQPTLVSQRTSTPITVTVVVSLKDYPAITPQQPTFEVTVICSVTSYTVGSNIADFNYFVTQGLHTTNQFAFQQVPNCGETETVATSFSKAGVPISQPSFITDTGSKSFAINSSSKSDCGDIKVVVSSQIALHTASFDFVIFVKDPCLTTAIDAIVGIRDMTASIQVDTDT